MSQATQWLGGRVPKRWTVAAVKPAMAQWLHRFGPEAVRNRTRKCDVVKQLQNKRSDRELILKGLVELLSSNVNRPTKEGAQSKLSSMSNVQSVKNYAWHDSVNTKRPAHGKKSVYFKTLEQCIADAGSGHVLFNGVCGYPKRISVVHVDLMNEVCKPPIRFHKTTTISECMLQPLPRKLCGI